MFYFVFIFGLIAGSFLNVVIHRLKNGRNMVFGRSFCPKCKTQLKWPDLAPLLSFVYLRGHCRYCRKKISWQYPIVEILSGFIWILAAYKSNFQFSIFNFQFLNLEILKYLNFFYYIFILSSFLIIAVYDFKWKIIPDKIVYPAIIVVFIYNFLKSLNLEILKYPLLTAVIAFFFFFLIYFFSSGRAMGLGDAKLAFLIGLFLSPSAAVLAFTLAFVIGAAFGIILMGFGRIFPQYKKWGMKSQIAFGPFLVLGVIIAFLFSNFINFIN